MVSRSKRSKKSKYQFRKVRFSRPKISRFSRMSKFVPKKYKAGSSMNSKQLQVWNFILTFVLGFMLVGLLLVTLTFAVFSRQLPTPDRLLERSYELSTRFYDKDGELIYEVFGEKNRTLVLLEEIDESVLHATLATEDSNFYQHSGFSLRGYARAVKNTLTGQGLQGGSTLTQQVIKNTLLSQERTVTRKIKEFILSLQLEGRYSKDEILQMYLNESPYGGQNYGIYSASKAYFNKDPKELSIAESAYLAGLPQSPTRYSPFGASPQAGLDRKDYVLYLMNVRGWADEKGDYHYLSDEDYEAAKEEELVFDTAKVAFKAPHFIFYTKQKLVEMFGEEVVEQGGLQVTTSLDSALQEKAEEIVLEEVTAAEYMNVWNGSLVALDAKTSQVRAMVGSKDYNLDPQPEGCTSGKAGDEGCKFDPYVNVSTSLRQPGSAIKPITYATMLSQGYTAATPLIDVPTKFKGATPDKPYEPENYDGEFRGPMSVRRSLANSINVSAVKALQIVGIDNMIKTAEKMGISSFNERERYGLAITLGGVETQLVELTGAFNVFAAKGLYREPTPIVEVKDSAGNILYKWQDTGGDRALDEKVAFLISDILSDDGARSAVFGLGGLLNIPGNRVAVKTGTTDDKRDNYAVGYTNDFTVGVWVGNNNNAAMNPYVASGITGATPIWNKFFKVYLADQEEPAKFEVPEGVTKMEVDELTGMLPTDGFSKRSEWFIDDSKPTAVSDWFSVLEICKKDGNIANDSCHDNGDTKKKTFVKISSAIPEWQYAVDAWVNEKFSGEDKYFPPSIVTRLEFNDDGDATNSSDIFVSIVGFDDGDTVPLDFRLRAEISTGKDIEKIRIYMDGEKVAEDGSKPFGYNFSLSPEQIGKHTFKVVAENEKGNKDDDEVELNVVGWAWD